MRAGQPPPGVTLLRPQAPSMPPTVTATPRVPSLVSLRPQDGHMPLSHSSRNLQVREPHQDFTWRRVLMLETNESRSKYCELETCTSWCKANRDESINMTSWKRIGTIDSEKIGGGPSGDIYTLHQDSVVQVVWWHAPF